MNMKDIQKKNDTDLQKHITEKREELRSIRFTTTGGGSRNTHARRNTRKEIARSLTELNKRAREATSNDA
jgi:ribosomal protein L29